MNKAVMVDDQLAMVGFRLRWVQPATACRIYAVGYYMIYMSALSVAVGAKFSVERDSSPPKKVIQTLVGDGP